MTAMVKAPISVLNIFPSPPERLVPPTTAAVMTSNSYDWPNVGAALFNCDAMMTPPNPAAGGHSGQATDDHRRGSRVQRPADVANQPRRRNGREGDQAADREIDAAGDDDQRHPNGHDRNNGNLIGDVEQIIDVEKRRPH